MSLVVQLLLWPRPLVTPAAPPPLRSALWPRPRRRLCSPATPLGARASYAPRSPACCNGLAARPLSMPPPPHLVQSSPSPPKPSVRAPQSVQAIALSVRVVAAPARICHGPSAPRPAPLRCWGCPWGSWSPSAAPDVARRPLPLLARGSPGPAAAANPSPFGPSHGEPPARFPERSTAPPSRPLPVVPVFVRGPTLLGGLGSLKDGPPMEPPGWYAPGSPLCCAFGPGDGGHGGGDGSNYC